MQLNICHIFMWYLICDNGKTNLNNREYKQKMLKDRRQRRLIKPPLKLGSRWVITSQRGYAM